MNRFFKGVASISLIGSAGAAVSGSVGCAKEVGRDAFVLRSGKEYFKAMRNLIDNFNDLTKENFRSAAFDFFALQEWAREVYSDGKDKKMIKKLNSTSDILTKIAEREVPEFLGSTAKLPKIIGDFLISCENEYRESHPIF